MNIIPKPIKATSDIHYNNLEYRRRLNELDKDGFKKLNIYLDLNNFNDEIKKYKLDKYKEVFERGMEKAVSTLTSLLKIKKYSKNYKFIDEQILLIGIKNWNKTIIGTDAFNRNRTFLTYNIDLIIFVRFGEEGELGAGEFASVIPHYIDSNDGHPLIGVAILNKDANFTKIKSKEYFESIIIHQITHFLGFSEYYFRNFFKNVFSKEDKYGILRFYINSTRVVNIARKYFNCSQIEGVELEESGGSGEAGSHWEARILLGDYMNGVIYPEEQVISEFTLALLEDFFFGIYDENIQIDTSCSSGRQSRAYHYLLQYRENISEEYQYYSRKNIGGYFLADYCPVSLGEISTESENRYYLGHCSDKKGSDVYGHDIVYESSGKRYYYESGYLSYITGEFLSDNSFCTLSSLKKADADFFSDIFRAICYPMFCSEKSLTILVFDNYIVCPRSGGKITALGFDGHLICPDYNLICSGTVLCNDMFDCVDKKSEMKENIYDYEIKTTQDLDDIKNDDIIENVYELSEDGKCPIFCSQCNIFGQCMKCKNDYGIIEEKGDIIKRYCLSNKELENGYYKKNNTYYKCIDKCSKCKDYSSCQECNNGYIPYSNSCYLEIKKCEIYNKNGTCKSCIKNYQVINNTCKYEDLNCEIYKEDSDNIICLECKDNYRLVKNICKVVISNCEKYDNDGLCDKCNEEYTIIDNNKTICQNKNILNDEYYSNDGGINYYKCDGEGEYKIKECKRCIYNDKKNIKLTCKECQENFVFLEDIENKCYSKELAYNKSFYLEDDSHLKSCSKKINNCFYCKKDNEKILCEKCMNNYFFINDNYLECIQKEKINPIDEYFLDEHKGCYYSCGNYSKIKNCKKCQNSENCILCKDNCTFINNNKSFCYEIKDLGNEYCLDPKDKDNYMKCSFYMNNCNLCESSSKCILCDENFIFINDDFKNCINKSEIPIDFYYTDNNITYYSCDVKQYKSNIKCFVNKTRKDIKFEILQAQIIKKKLVIFMVISLAFPKELSLITKISKYNANTRRNLQKKEEEIILKTSDDSDGSSNKLIKFESEQEIISQSQENIQIKEIAFNNDDETTSAISKHNNCQINLPKNTDFLDTGKVKTFIEEKSIPDYSKIKQDNSNINSIEYLYINNINGCNIELKSGNSYDTILNNSINITFIEKSNKLNEVSAICSISEEKDGVIPCKINRNANNIYFINSEPINDNDKCIIISSTNKDINNYKIECLINNEKKISKTLIITCSLFAFIIIIVITICLIKIKKVNNKNKKYIGEKPDKNKIDDNSNDNSKDFVIK